MSLKDTLVSAGKVLFAFWALSLGLSAIVVAVAVPVAGVG